MNLRAGITNLGIKSLLLAASLFAANCSGKTYSTLMKPFDIIFDRPNNTVDSSLLAATPLTNTRVMLTFSKFVTLASGQDVTNYSIKDANGNLLHILAASRDPVNSKVVYLDTVPQAAGREYTVIARNIIGVDGSSLGSSNSAKFTAPNNTDQTGPAFSSVTALSSTKVEVYFNEAVDRVSAETAGNYTIYDAPNCTGSMLAVSPANRDSLNYAKVTLTTAPMTSGTTYYVCGTTGLKDIWGNANAASFSSSAFVYNAPAPKVVSAVFNGAGANSTLLVTYDQAMTTSGAIATKTPYAIGGCTGGGSITNAGATVAAIGNHQVLISSLNLAAGSSGQCTLTVATAGITSALGATLSNTDNTAVFAYSATDTTSPAIVSITPTDTNTLEVVFTEPVDAGSVDPGSFNFSPALGVTNVSCTGNVCTVTTAEQTTTTYTATVSGVKDAAGNTVGGAGATATFTGDGRPYIVGIYPDDPTTLYVQWSEPLAGTALSDYEIKDSDGNVITITTAALDPTAPSAWVKLTLNSPGTTSGTGYTVTLPTTAGTTDTTGNTGLATIPGGGTFTGPTTTHAPQVTGASSPNASVVFVNFNEPLNNSTITPAAFTFDGGCPVSTVNSTAQIQAGVVQLAVTAGLSDGACTVTVASVKDLAGNPIGATDNTATFNYTGTGSADTAAPTVASVVALDNTHIKVFFSEPVDTSNGANGGANLANYVFSPVLAGGVSGIVCSGTACTLTLNAPGTSAVQYALTVSNIQDTAGTPNTMTSQTVQFSGIGSSVAAPMLYLATLINATTVELTFSEAMALMAAKTAGNYTVTGGNTVTAAAVQADATKVRLTLAPGAFGSSNSYTVTAASVTDLDGNAIDTTHNSATFNGSATAPSSAALAAVSDTGVVGDNITGAGLAFPTPGMQFTGTTTPNTIVTLYMDGVPVGSAVSNASGGYTVTQTTQPSEGAHTYSVATVGPTGLVSDLSPTISVTFDSLPPAQPSATPVLAAASDSGISNTDAVTNATTNLVITGAAGAVEPNSAVTLYDGVTVIGTATAAADGSYSVTVAGPLSEGAHSVTVKATDAAGNQSVANATPLNLTVDTTAPALQTPVVLMANSYIDLTFPEGLYGSNTSNTPLDVSMLHFTLNSGGSGITINPTVTRTDGSPLTGGETTVRVNLNTSGTPDGSETIQVTSKNNAIYDAAGNTVSFDTGIKNFSAAGVPNIVGTPTYTSTGLNAGYITVTWDEAPYTVTGASGVLVSGDFTTAFNANGGNAASFSITGLQNGSGGALSTGDTTMRILVQFNTTTSGAETFQVNAKSSEIFSGVSPYLNSPMTEQAGPFTAPDKLTPTVLNVTSPNTDGYYKAGDTISIQVVFSENVTVTGTPQLTLATGTPATTAVNYASGSGTNVLIFTYAVAAGNSNADLDYSATTALSLNGGSIKDAAGNNATLTLANPGAATSLGANKALNVDAVIPNAPPNLRLAAADDTGSSNSDGVTKNKTNLHFEGTGAEANATIKLYYPNTSGTLVGTATADGAGAWTVTSALVWADGTYSIIATATDAAGNVSTASGAMALVVDTTAPTNQNTVFATAADAKGGDAVTIVGSGTASNTVWFAPAGTTVFTTGPTMTQAGGTAASINAPASDGTYYLYVVDLAGNASPASTAALTVDNTAPTGYTVVIDQTAINNANKTAVSFTFASAEVGATYNYSFTSSGGGGAINGSGTISSATQQITGLDLSSLGDGTVTLSVTLTDKAGNTGTAATNTKIKDVIAPTITATSPANSAGVTSGAVDYTLSEDCSTAQFTWTRTGGAADVTSPHTRVLTGAELNAGTHSSITFGSNPLVGGSIYTVSWDCTDIAGNAATTVTATGITYSDGPPVILSALALDTNYNGKIDTYQVTFNKNINDSTFPGYVTNSLGNAQTDWLVSGYTNVRLLNGSAVTFATDTPNDSLIYIRFNENVLACNAADQTGCDTDVKPDLTTSATPGVSDGVLTLAQVGVSTVTEADGAAPVTVRALSLGPNSLDVTFSEPMNATQANDPTNYTLTGGLTVSAAVRDASDFKIVHLTTSAQTGGTSYTLTVNTLLRDMVNINLITLTNPTTGLPGNQAQFNGVDKPVVVNIVTKSATTVLIQINENIIEATGACANQTACALIYENISLPVLSAVAANAAGTPTAGDSKYFLLTVNPMVEQQLYTTYIKQGTMESAATSQKMGNTNNSATFNGDGRPALSISADTATECPSPTNLPPSVPARRRLVVQYDQAVDSSATTAANYTIPTSGAGGCVQPTCSSGLNQTASTVTSMGGNKYAVDWPTAFDTAGTPPNGNIYLLNVANVKDMNGNAVATPTTAQFQCGNDNTPPMLASVTVVSANNAAVVVLLTFSEAVDNVTANLAANYRYDSQPYGTNVTTAARQSNQAQVLVTFTPGTALSDGGHQMRVINVKDQSANSIIDNGVGNVQPFIVNAPGNFDGGPVFEDPFADGTPAGQIVRYNDKLLLGWNNGSSQLFEMNNGLTTAQTIILDVDGNPSMPYTALANFNSGAGNNETDGGSKIIIGIDAIASACARTATATGSWKASLTGAACTAQNGVEYLLMGGFNSSGYYKSYFTTTDTSNTTTHFTFNHRVHQTDSSNTFRSMTMVVFSDWLYVASPHVGYFAPMLTRICINKDGCNDGVARAFWTAVHAGNAGAVGSPGTDGLLPMLSKMATSSAANTGSSPNSWDWTSTVNNTVSIDVIYEYDNDGVGANVSQLYMANGGRFGGTVGYGTGTPRINIAAPGHDTSKLGTDGGIIRSRLGRSTATRPPGCGTAYGVAPIANDAATCLTNGFENITPTSQDWLDYMSIALPYRSDGTTDWYDMLPSNRIIPAMKAVPYMRTAPNGDLYMIRNACATAIMQTKCMVGGGAPCLGAGPVAARLNDRFNDNFATAATGRHQTCPPGYEVPQLWVLPAKGASGTGGGGEGGNNNAADWKLVAGSLFTPPAFAQGTNTVTPRTDVLPQRKATTLRGNTTTCGSSPNKCERNAHLTLMEFVGNTLYLGFDNQDYGANVWRVDFTNSSCTGSSDCMTPGKVPAETSFQIVNNVLGLDGSSVNQRIFSHVAVTDGGTDWLILVTRDGGNSMKIYRTANP